MFVLPSVYWGVICTCGKVFWISLSWWGLESWWPGWSGLYMASSSLAAKAKRETSIYNLFAIAQRSLFLGKASSCCDGQHPPCIFLVCGVSVGHLQGKGGRDALMGAHPFSCSSSWVSSCLPCSQGGWEEASVVWAYGVEWAEQETFPGLVVPEAGLLGPNPQPCHMEPWSQAACPWGPSMLALCSSRPWSSPFTLHPYCSVTWDKLLKLSGPQLSHLQSGVTAVPPPLLWWEGN